MNWIKGNHPTKTEYLGIRNSKQALVRKQCGLNSPHYRVEFWMGDRWTNDNGGATVITHYMWIEEIKENKQ